MSDRFWSKLEGDALEKVPRWPRQIEGAVTSGLGDIAHQGARYIRSKFLHGKALQRITGTTEESVGAYYDKTKGHKGWYIRPGIGIRGSLNYLARWTGTSHEFMKPGWREFQASISVEDYLRKKVEERTK